MIHPLCASAPLREIIPLPKPALSALLLRTVLLALAVVALGPLRAGEWQLELRSGERLTGEVRSLDGALRLYDPALQAERTFEITALARLSQAGTAPAPLAGSVLTLRNGDLLAGPRITLDPAGLRLDLPGGGSLHAPREQLATLEPRQTGALASVTDLDDLLAGADGAPGWVRTATGCQARALPATLARQGVLSKRVRVVLEVPAAPPPDLWVYLFTDSTAQPAGDSYALSLQGEAVALERQYAKGPPRPIGTCRLAPPANAVCSVTLTADLAQGHFRLETPAGLGGDWTDAGTDAPAGRGLALVCLKLPAELRRLTVTRLPSADTEVAVAAASPTVDRVYLENGDRTEGEIVAIDAAAWSVRRPTSPVPLQIPAAAVRLARFRAAAVAPAATTPGIAVRLYSGSRFKAASVSIQENHLRVRSPVWGEAEFPLADLHELRFVTP